jgi:hypothetical protein
VSAQQEAVAVAVRHIFSIAAVFALLCLVMTLALKGVPLRRVHAPATAAEGAVAADGRLSAAPESLPGGADVTPRTQ